MTPSQVMANLADATENPDFVGLAEMVDVLGHEMGVPSAAVDRDSLHFSSAYTAARCCICRWRRRCTHGDTSGHRERVLAGLKIGGCAKNEAPVLRGGSAPRGR